MKEEQETITNKLGNEEIISRPRSMMKKAKPAKSGEKKKEGKV